MHRVVRLAGARPGLLHVRLDFALLRDRLVDCFEEAFAEEWARGRAMTLLDAIDQAITEQREVESDVQ